MDSVIDGIRLGVCCSLSVTVWICALRELVICMSQHGDGATLDVISSTEGLFW